MPRSAAYWRTPQARRWRPRSRTDVQQCYGASMASVVDAATVNRAAAVKMSFNNHRLVVTAGTHRKPLTKLSDSRQAFSSRRRDCGRSSAIYAQCSQISTASPPCAKIVSPAPIGYGLPMSLSQTERARPASAARPRTLVLQSGLGHLERQRLAHRRHRGRMPSCGGSPSRSAGSISASATADRCSVHFGLPSRPPSWWPLWAYCIPDCLTWSYTTTCRSSPSRWCSGAFSRPSSAEACTCFTLGRKHHPLHANAVHPASDAGRRSQRHRARPTTSSSSWPSMPGSITGPAGTRCTRSQPSRSG